MLARLGNGLLREVLLDAIGDRARSQRGHVVAQLAARHYNVADHRNNITSAAGRHGHLIY